jgi:hypothetical protein
MVVVNLTVPRLKSTTNIRSVRTDRPHQMYPDLYTLSSSFIMIPTSTTSISDRHIKRAWKSILYTMPCPQKKKKGTNLQPINSKWDIRQQQATNSLLLLDSLRYIRLLFQRVDSCIHQNSLGFGFYTTL